MIITTVVNYLLLNEYKIHIQQFKVLVESFHNQRNITWPKYVFAKNLILKVIKRQSFSRSEPGFSQTHLQNLP